VEVVQAFKEMDQHQVLVHKVVVVVVLAARQLDFILRHRCQVHNPTQSAVLVVHLLLELHQ
jgi:hypothetical protein